jgi:parallel beta-helix repeat protein
MKTKQKGRIVVSILALASLVAFSLMSYAGSLEPSAAPGPTMKTLDEVEPRVPIHASDLPLTISEPNSYYLVEDVNFTDDANAITIECNDVTIDLMGYTLKGPDSGNKSGIYMNRRTNVEIRNGTVRDFYNGIYEFSDYGTQHRIMNVRAMSNQYYGIRLLGYGHLIKDCTATKNKHGITAHNGCTVTGNTCYDNDNEGIIVDTGCTVTGNTCYDNGNDGIDSFSSCTLTGNTAYDNDSYGIRTGSGCTLTGNTVYKNSYSGILAGTGSTVTGNTAYRNNQSDKTYHAGIEVNAGCLVKGNTARGNKRYNIYVDDHDNAIEENLVTDSNNGIYFGDNGNFYANNRASGNAEDYNDVDFPSQTDGGGNVSF